MTNLNQLISLAALLLITGCNTGNQKNGSENTQDPTVANSSEEMRYRPNFHFTPQKNWMNDPNGMFFHNGYYHLYFQYHPGGNTWGPMHWGHAISKDMITWQEQPVALYPDTLGYIFSGSAVVDHHNTSGFGKDGKTPVVAIFTNHDPQKASDKKTDVETQGIAYSLDEGLTWTKYAENPVIENPGIRDFRDPKVRWDDQRKRWLMVLAAQNKTMFYVSGDLKKWEFLSDFGADKGSHAGVWECPDFFPIRVEGTSQTKWVLLVSINPGAPNGGSGTQYFVGDFDGTHFTPDAGFDRHLSEKHDYWLDFGRDNYAGVTWSDIPGSDGRRLFIGWMSNWDYANQVPTETWRSASTIARELKLHENADSYVLSSVPVKELNNYLEQKLKKEKITITENTELTNSKSVDLTRTHISFGIGDSKNKGFVFTLSNASGDTLRFGYDGTANDFHINRKQSGHHNFSDRFADRISTAPRSSKAGSLTGTILLDKTSVELFYDNGRTVMTEIFFPTSPFETLSVENMNENILIDFIEMSQIGRNKKQ